MSYSGMTSGDLPSAAGSASTYQAAASSAGAIGMMMQTGTAQNVITTIARLQADLPNDLQQLKDLTTEMILSHMVHQEKCREWMYQLIDDKHVAQHRSNMLERAAVGGTAGDFINQLEFLSTENEKQSAQLTAVKTAKAQLERDKQEMIEFYEFELGQYHEQQDLMKRSYETSQIRLKQAQETALKDVGEMARLKAEVDTLRMKVVAKGSESSTAIEEKLLADIQRQTQARASVEFDFIFKDEKISSLETELFVAREEINRLREARIKRFDDGPLLPQANEQEQQDEANGLLVFQKADDGSKLLKAGTTEKLIERLTSAHVHGLLSFYSVFRQAFLLTYRSFMSGQQLLDALIQRYNANMPEEGKNTPTAIQVTVCTLIKYWVNSQWYDFERDPELLKRVQSFVATVETKSEKVAEIIKSSIQKKKGDTNKNAFRPSTVQTPKPILPKSLVKRYSQNVNNLINASSSTPTPLFSGDETATSTEQQQQQQSPSSSQPHLPQGPPPVIGGQLSTNESSRKSAWGPFIMPSKRPTETTDGKLRFIEMDPHELARQLTLLEFQLYERIKSSELIDLAWMKPGKEERAPGVCAITAWSNHVVRWLETEIVSCHDPKQRASTFEKVIQMGHHCDKLNNLNGVQEISAALQSASVHRLHKTKEQIPNKIIKQMDELQNLTANNFNFAMLRGRITNSEPPLIPFPGLYQTDLTMIDGSQKTMLPNNLINFTKQQKVASYITEFLCHQQTPYDLEPIPEIMEYIKDFTPLDEHTAWNMSQICEPRQAAPQ